MTDPGDHDDLEQAMRDGLQHRAERADTSAQVAARARTAARRRRGARRAAGVAGLAVAAVAVTGFVLQQTGPARTQPPALAPYHPSPSATSTPGADGSWRTESWHGVQVDVPTAWGWGAAPQSLDGNQDEIFFCGGPGAMVTSDGERLANPDPSVPYVGRPVMLSDLCTGGAETGPLAPYVWFDAEGVDPGTEDLGNGYVRETREIGGSTVSVASPDAGLRARILDSARPVEECPGRLDAPPRADPHMIHGIVPARAMAVCDYESDSDGAVDLVYATSLPASVAERLVSKAHLADPVNNPCPSSSGEYVVLGYTDPDRSGDGAESHTLVVDLGCSAIEVDRGDYRELTPATVLPWATGGTSAVLHGPNGGKGAMLDYFIGMLG